MTKIDDLLGRVRSVATEVRNSVRTEPTNKRLAGWGQFVEPSSQVFQIGPYGTSAGILLAQVENPDSPVDGRVKAQMLEFWNAKPNGKLFPQNVRLAFVVLALARSNDKELAALRNEIASELKARQLSDGSWSDATPHASAPTGGQNDATAWVALALFRTDKNDAAAHRAAEWLVRRVEGTGNISILSPISLAVALLTHPNASNLSQLRDRAFDLLKSRRLAGELISFFDYEELNASDEAEQKRDYLCFPAFFIEAVLVHGLSKDAGIVERQRLAAYGLEITDKMVSLTSGSPYKLAGARFTSTVDQAFYALGYEHLADAQANTGRGASFAAPMYNRFENSVWMQLIIPTLLLICALLSLEDANAVPGFLVSIFGPKLQPASDFAVTNSTLIKLVAALILVVLPNVPLRGWKIFKAKILGI